MRHSERHRRYKHWWTSERGAAALEFALVLPFVLLLIYGVIEVGRAYQAQLAVTTAAREGARLAAVGDYSKADVEARAYPLNDPKHISGLTVPASPTVNGDSVTVVVTFNYTPLLLGDIDRWFSDETAGNASWTSLVLRSEATMRKE